MVDPKHVHDVTKQNGRVPIPKGYTAAELVRTKFPPPRWAVPGILRHGVCVLAGMPKLGKSYLCLGLGLAIAGGGKALGQIDVEPGEVMYLCLEDDWESAQERIVQVWGDVNVPDKLHLYNEWPRLGKTKGALALDEWLTDHPDCRMVIVDTLAYMRPLQGGSRSLYDDDHNTIAAFKQIADRHRVCIIIVTHLSKAAREDPFQNVNATLGLTGAADEMIVMQTSVGKFDATLHIKGRRVRWQELAIKWDINTMTWSLMGKAEDYKDTFERDLIKQTLHDSPLPLTPREVAKLTGKAESATKKLMWTMKAENVLDATDGHYSLTPATRAKMDQPLEERVKEAVVAVERVLGETQTQLPLHASNPGNRRTQANGTVTEATPATTVTPVTSVTYDESGIVVEEDGDYEATCFGCGCVLPRGWYIYCPLCEEKREANGDGR